MDDERTIQALCDEYSDQLEISECVLSKPEMYIAALEYGLGPGDNQSLGEWIAETINDARLRVAKNSKLCAVKEQGSHRDLGTAESTRPVTGE